MNFFGGDDNSDDVSRYQAGKEDLSSKELRFGKWYLQHRVQIRKGIIAALFLFSLITLGGSLVYWSYYFASGYWQDQEIAVREARQFQNYQRLHPLYEARSPEVSNIEIVQADSGEYNIVADVDNRNERWLGEMSYHFSFPGGETKTKQTTILPLRKNTTAIFGVENSSVTQGAEFVLDNIKWKNIDPHKIRNIDNYSNARLNFSVNNFSFSQGDEDTPANVSFGVKNDTAYSYWDGRFIVKLFQGNSLVAAREISIDKFRTGEERSVNLTFSQNVNITRVELNPKINIFDQDEFMGPPSQ
ncbi:MAG: hypothetical protein ABEJ02_01435 [Candidatus Paceibacteria bacterium]